MRIRALLFAGLLLALSLIAAPANAASKPIRTVDTTNVNFIVDSCGDFSVLINGTLTSITLDFGDRKIVLLPGANVTLTRLDEGGNPIGEPLLVKIPGPEFDQLNPDGSTALFTANGPWLWLAFNPANPNEEGLFLTDGKVVINPITGLPIEFNGTSRNLCTQLAA
jgi:hypothetical protein